MLALSLLSLLISISNARSMPSEFGSVKVSLFSDVSRYPVATHDASSISILGLGKQRRQTFSSILAGLLSVTNPKNEIIHILSILKMV